MADNAKWYVIHTYSGYENAVKAAIEKSVVNRNMSDMVLKMEIPMAVSYTHLDVYKRQVVPPFSIQALFSLFLPVTHIIVHPVVRINREK